MKKNRFATHLTRSNGLKRFLSYSLLNYSLQFFLSLERASSIAAKSWEATFSSPTTTKQDAHKSLTINIDVTAMKELLRLTQTNEPLWIKTDGCLDVLSLKSYENAFPRLSIRGGKNHNLRVEVKARELFPSIVALEWFLLDCVEITEMPYI
ncbi:unnamed protein product [Brassica oleracea var. botrytis]